MVTPNLNDFKDLFVATGPYLDVRSETLPAGFTTEDEITKLFQTQEVFMRMFTLLLSSSTHSLFITISCSFTEPSSLLGTTADKDV